SEAGVNIGIPCLVADLREDLPDARRIVISPAVIVRDAAGDEVLGVLAVATRGDLRRLAAPGAVLDRKARARKFEPTLGRYGECAAQRIEPEYGVGAGDDREAGDRGRRDQVPVDRVAEGLINAHTVDEHGNALRRAQDRRGGKAAEVHV